MSMERCKLWAMIYVYNGLFQTLKGFNDLLFCNLLHQLPDK